MLQTRIATSQNLGRPKKKVCRLQSRLSLLDSIQDAASAARPDWLVPLAGPPPAIGPALSATAASARGGSQTAVPAIPPPFPGTLRVPG